MSYVFQQNLASIKDEALLLHALKVLGFEVEQNAEPVTVRGWRNETLRQRCRLVIRRENANLNADIGFHKADDGSFTIISDDFANKKVAEFGMTLKRTYEEERAIAQARLQGFKHVQRGQWIEKDGKKYVRLLISQ